MNTDKEFDELADRIAGLENFIHEFMPMLIAASPAREQIQAQLSAWASAETDHMDRERHYAVTMAADTLEMLQAL